MFEKDGETFKMAAALVATKGVQTDIQDIKSQLDVRMTLWG